MTDADRQKRARDRRKSEGKVLVRVWVPAAAIAALEAEVAGWRVRVERIQAELIARGADSVGDEASAYNDAALALRVLLDSAALAQHPAADVAQENPRNPPMQG